MARIQIHTSQIQSSVSFKTIKSHLHQRNENLPTSLYRFWYGVKTGHTAGAWKSTLELMKEEKTNLWVELCFGRQLIGIWEKKLYFTAFHYLFTHCWSHMVWTVPVVSVGCRHSPRYCWWYWWEALGRCCFCQPGAGKNALTPGYWFHPFECLSKAGKTTQFGKDHPSLPDVRMRCHLYGTAKKTDMIYCHKWGCTDQV